MTSETKGVPEDALEVVDADSGQLDLHDLCVALFGAAETDNLVLHHSAFCGIYDQVENIEEACSVLSEQPLNPTLKGKLDAFLTTSACRRLEMVQDIVRTKRDLRTAIEACSDASVNSKQAFGISVREIDLAHLALCRALASLDAEFGNVWHLDLLTNK